MAAPDVPPSSRPTADSAHRGGFTIREYERHVWDMAKSQVNPAFLFVAAQVAGATRLLDHASFSNPGATLRESALFLAGFLGAWACFYSTMLRVAGLRSLAVTFLVPLAIVAALAIWFVFPPPTQMSAGTLLAAEALLAGPGVVGWFTTMRRWRAAEREARKEPPSP